MTWRCVVLLVAVLVLWSAAPTRADFYDCFADGETHGGAPGWDIDDPCWLLYPLVGADEIFEVQGPGRWLRMYIWSGLGYSFLATMVNDGDVDPNTSATYWDDMTSHYIMAKVAHSGMDPCDPDYDPNYGSRAILLLHGDPVTWLTYWLLYEMSETRPWGGGWFVAESENGMDTYRFEGKTIRGRDPNHYPGARVDLLYDPNDPNFWPDPDDPNTDPNTYDPNDPFWQDWRDPNWIMYDPNMLNFHNMWTTPGYMNEAYGFWMCLQFRADDSNYPSGDPNGKSIWGACWNGDKFDWDGGWVVGRDMTGWDPDGDPDPKTSWWPEQAYNASGWSGMASYGNAETGITADLVFDSVEARTGVFTNTSRTLTLKMKDCCDLTVDPDLLDDLTGDPNNLNALRRYTDGTAIVLSGVVPVGNKVFKKWTIKGPNDSGDPLYQVVTDTNEIVYLTMDGDYVAKATCKCGGGGIEPFAGIVLLVLGVGVAIRRLA